MAKWPFLSHKTGPRSSRELEGRCRGWVAEQCNAAENESVKCNTMQQPYGVEQQRSGCSGGGQEKETGAGRSTSTQLKLRLTSTQLRATQSLLLIRSSAGLFILNASHVHGLQKSKKFKIQRKANF